MTVHGHYRRLGLVLHVLLLGGLVTGLGGLVTGLALPSGALAADGGQPGRPIWSLAADGGQPGRGSAPTTSLRPPATIQAQPAAPMTPPAVSPLPTPGPIVPRGNPVGKVGIAAMVVAAAAGLWIYRVIRKGL